MVTIKSKAIPCKPRSNYYNSSGSVYISTGGGGNNSNGSSVDLSDVAKLSGYNVFTGNNTFKGGITIDNPSSELSIQSNSVGVASLRYSNACFELKNIKSNKSLQLHDDGRFEFDGNKILTAKNFEDELNAVYVTLKTVQTITGEKTFDASITLTENSRICSEGNLLHYKDGTSHAIWDASNSNLNTVDWEAKNIITTAVRTSKDGNAILQYINGNINVGYSQGCTFILGDSDVLHQKTGVNYVVWDASNSNLNTVDWTAKDLSANNNVQTLNFASGWAGAGCRIDNNGKAECSDLFVRGSLNVYELVINRINATNGALAVTDSGKVASIYGSVITLTGDNGNMNTFRVGDVLKCQNFTGKAVKLYLLTVTAVSGLTVTFSYKSGGSGVNVVAANDVVIRWNSSDANRKGLLYLTASDSNAPYMDVMHDEKTRVRLGRLDGISGLSGYGIVGRDNSLNNIFHISSNGTASIAGWTFDNAKFKGGNLELVASGIIRHTGGKYSLNNDGSGKLANGNISWNAAGDVTFGNSVSLQWTNDAINAATGVVNNIQIGGANLLNNSSNWRDAGWNGGYANNGGGYTIDSSVLFNGKPTLKSDVGNGLVHSNWLTLENNVEYTYSAMVRCNKTISGNDSSPLHYWAGLNQVNQGKITIISRDNSVVANVWKRIYITFKLTSDANSFRPFFYRGNNESTYYWIAYFKLEKGNKATDWSQSDSDTNKLASDAQSTATAAQSTATTANNTATTANNTANNTVNALGGSSYPKLTKIDANGIYTGTLTAGQVNAVAINAGSITSGTLNAGRIASRSITADKIQAGSLTATEINVSSLFSNMITTNNITITSGGRIGNFVITSDGSLNNEYGYGSIYLRNNFKQTSLSPGFLSIQGTSGGHALFINRADQQGGDVTIMGRYGVFDFSSLDIKGNNNLIRGLCFNARTTAYTTTLTNEDVWLTCTNSGTITVTLPSSPPTGKVLFIKKLTGSRVALSSSKPITSVSTFYSINLDSAGYVTVLVFDGTRWCFSQIPP